MANPYTYSGRGEGFLEDNSNLAAAGSAFQGFVEGWQKASDNQMKRQEHDAQMAALQTKMERERDQSRIEEAKAGYTRDLQNNLVRDPARLKEAAILKLAPSGLVPEFDENQNISGTHYSNEYMDVLKAKAEIDPYGLKRAAAENANKPKEYEFVSAGFAKRMQGAEQKYASLLASGFDPTGVGVQAEQSLMKGPLEAGKRGPTKQYEQIVRDFASAILRKESGAAISPKEYEDTNKLYFPQPGDTPEVIAQKEASRAQAFNNLRTQGGKAFDLTPSAPVGLVPKGLVSKKSGLVKGSAAAKDKPKTVIQNGHTYTLNPQTGEYE